MLSNNNKMKNKKLSRIFFRADYFLILRNMIDGNKTKRKKKYKWISQACRGFSDTAMKTADDLLQSNQIQNVINGLLFLIFRSVCLCFSFQNNILNMTHIIITIFYENIRFLFIDLVISNGWQTEFYLIEINGPTHKV